MSENLYSPGQKVLSEQGRDNWDRIFGVKTLDRRIYDILKSGFKTDGYRGGKDGDSEKTAACDSR